MVKVILQLYPQVKATRQERIDQRPLGRDAERYQALIREMPTIVKAADELGLWGISSIEHHFHSEGYEVGPEPGPAGRLLGGDHQEHPGRPARLHDERAEPVPRGGGRRDHRPPLRRPVLLRVLPRLPGAVDEHPRPAPRRRRRRSSPSGNQEKMAELDEATQAARISDDQINREIFEENVELVLQAWTQDSVEAKGRWQVPFPYEEGVDWTMTATREIGAPGEMDEHNKIRRVSVMPSPLTKPYPPIFVSSNASKETIEYCGPRGFIPTYFSKIERAAEFGAAYVDAAAVGGPDVRARPEPGPRPVGADGGDRGGGPPDGRRVRRRHLPGPLRRHDPDEVRPRERRGLGDQLGLWVVGTPDQVRDQYVELWRQLPAEYVVLIYHWAQQPAESVVRQLELFMEHVKPALDEMTPYEA